METCGYKYLFCGVKASFYWLNIVLFVLLLISHSTSGILVENVNTNKGENVTKVENWNISALSEAEENSFKTIIKEFDKLKIFQSYGLGKGCFSLRNVRQEESITKTSKKYIEISFTFEEMEINSDRLLALQVETSETQDNVIYGNGNLVSNGCQERSPLRESKGLNKLSRTRSEKIPSVIKSDSDSGNMTATSDILPVSGEDKNNSDKEKGLSRTQVVIIATCSAVLGTFFIIAGALRVRSCLNRYRANREAALTVARRASGSGFGGSGNIRRDSASSKASRQSRTTSKAGSDSNVDRNGKSPPSLSHNSPLHNSDHKPLLPARIVDQFSDGCSSHGSLAFIDEEAQSKAQQNDNHSGSDLGSDDDSLLRKSPDSGSSIDVTMADDDVKEKHMTSSRNSVPSDGNISTSPNERMTSPDRKIIFEPGGDTDMDSENNEINSSSISIPMNLESGDIDGNNGDSPISESSRLLNDQDINSADFTHSNRNKEPRNFKQFSVDYFEEDEVGMNFLGPISEEDDKHLKNGGLIEPENLTENHAVTSGLTQSDTSLSDNPSYSYGNQTEYDYFGGFGQKGYCCPFGIYTDSSEIKQRETGLINYSLRNSEVLSSELLYRENGEMLNESFDECYLNGTYSRPDSSAGEATADRPDLHKMYSVDSYFDQNLEQRNLSAGSGMSSLRGHGPSDENTRRNLHIVPLAEYKRETIDEDDIL